MSEKENRDDLGRLIKDGYSAPPPGEGFAESLGSRLRRELKPQAAATEKPPARPHRARFMAGLARHWPLAPAVAACVVLGLVASPLIFRPAADEGMAPVGTAARHGTSGAIVKGTGGPVARGAGAAGKEVIALPWAFTGPRRHPRTPSPPQPPATFRPVIPAHIPREGLAALWLADDNAFDSAGKHHGALPNGAKFARGKAGKCFVLDGKDDCITMGDVLDWGTGSWSVAVWFRKASPGPTGPEYAKLINKGQSDYGSPAEVGYGLELDAGQVQFQLIQPARRQFEAGTKEPTDTQWHHVAGVLDRNAGEMRLYLDGRLAAKRSIAGLGSLDTDLPLCVGSLHRGGRDAKLGFFRGDIDEAAMWNRPLSGEEVAGLCDTIPPALPHGARVDQADRIALAGGSVLLGTIENDRFTVTASFGKVELAPGRVVGLLRDEKKDAPVRLALTDGQVLAGKLAEETIMLKLSTGSTLRVPVDSILQCGYRICDARPADPAPAGAMAILRSGERLVLADADLGLQLQTSHGRIDLPVKGLLRIDSPAGEGPPQRARFVNGSVLSGGLLPEKLTLKLQLGPELTVGSDKLRRLVLPGRPAPPADEVTLLMHNGDRLIGRVTDEKFTIKTKFGDAEVRPESLLTIDFEAEQPGLVSVRQWDGVVLRGQLALTALGFEISPEGPTLKVAAEHIASIVRPVALPPPAIRKKIETLIARLGADSYKDREAAAEALTAMGPEIAPLLRKHVNSDDPEIRQRVQLILEQLSAKPVREAPADRPGPPAGVSVPRGARGNFPLDNSSKRKSG